MGKGEVIDLICALHAHGIGLRLTAEMLGYSYEWIRKLRDQMGLPTLPHDNRAREQRLDAISDPILFRCETVREASKSYLQATLSCVDEAA